MMPGQVDTPELIDAIASIGLRIGLYEAVLLAEPKSAPTQDGCVLAVWCSNWVPVPHMSGQAETAMLLLLRARAYWSFIKIPEDEIDKELSMRADALHRELNLDINIGLGDDVGVEIDLLKQASDGVNTALGFIKLDEKIFRVADTEIPILTTAYYTQGRG
jgi:hypothetical protein